MASFIVVFSFMLCLSNSGVYSGSHTLRYYMTIVSAPAPGLPEFSIVAFVDDLMLGRYSSDIHNIKASIPIPNIFSDHVKMQTHHALRLEEVKKKGMSRVMEFSNKTYGTADIHVYQKKFICELHDDGSIGGYQDAAFDGQEFATFDRENGVFVPLTQKASAMFQQCADCDWHAKSDKFYMENYCVQDLKMYLLFLTTLLDKKVRPHVNVSSTGSDKVTQLHCWVYGFQPRDVEVKWIKNERDEIESEEATQILPNPDGTYQIRVSVEVTPEEGATYSCHVDHSTLNETLVVPFETKKGGIFHIIIPVITAILLLTVVLGILKWRNIKGSNQSVNTTED